MAEVKKTELSPEEIKVQEEAEKAKQIENLERAAEMLEKHKGVPKQVEALGKKIEELESNKNSAAEKAVEEGAKAAEVAEATKKAHEDEKKAYADRFEALEAKSIVRHPAQNDTEEKFSFGKLFNAMLTNDWSGAPFEQKALGEGTGSAGGYLVPEQNVEEVKDRITAQSVIRSLGVTVYPMATDTLNIPSVSGGATAYWTAENAQITSSDQTFAQKQLVAKMLTAMVKVSNQLLQDSSGKAEAAIRRDMVKVMALTEDLAFIQGTGASNQPTGVLNTANVNEVTLGANGGTPSYDNLYDTLYQIELNNGVASGWVMHPRTKNTIRKIKDTAGVYIYNVSPSLKEPDTLFGLPVKLTTQIPVALTVGSSSDCSFVLCGQWDEAIVGDKAGMEFAVDQSGTAFEYYQTWIRSIARLDFVLRTPEVFTKLTGARP